MNKYLKATIHVIGILLSIGVIWPLFFVTNDWGIDWLNQHNRGQRWLLIGIALVLSALAGIIIGGFKDFLNNHWSETVASETRYNPAWGWAVAAFIVNVAIIMLLE